jgi:hypothetical protein
MPYGLFDASLFDASVIVPFIRSRNLNYKQTMAFLVRVFAVALYQADVPSTARRFFLTGDAGTGKSVVMKAFTDFGLKMGIHQHHRRLSPTATAASLINGRTIASVFAMGRGRRKNDPDEDSMPSQYSAKEIPDAQRALLSASRIYDIDEVSMLGHNTMAYIHDALNACYSNQAGSPFGGCLMFFTGDQYQFDPVGDAALYKPSPLPSNLWSELTDTICLTTIMRQDPDEVAFLEVLRRLRKSECTDADYDLLNERVLGGHLVHNLIHDRWQDALYIVARHNLRREINRRRAYAYCCKRQKRLYAFPAYYQSKEGSASEEQVKKLRSLSLNMHDNTESYLYFHEDMPAVLNENLHTLQGITNGAYGRIGKIVLDPREPTPEANEKGIHVLRYAPVQILFQLARPHSNRAHLTDLAENVIPIFASPRSVTIVVKEWREALSNRKRKITRTFKFHQFSFSPAYAVTDYRCQGDTLPSVVVDLRRPPTGTPDPAAAYVAISRVTSITGLAILRDFKLSDISGPGKPGLRAETARLEELERETIQRVLQTAQRYGIHTDLQNYLATCI